MTFTLNTGLTESFQPGEFESSDGVKVAVWPTGSLVVSDNRDGRTDCVSPFTVRALREYFRAEEDERLGRFRDLNTPGYVAYDRGEGYVRVVREADGTSEVYLRQDVEQPGGLKPAVVARAFFDAHPEPKPWALAQDGEVWLLTGNGHPDEERAYIVVDHRFFAVPVKRPIDPGWKPAGFAADFTSGERFWPEATS